MARCGVLWVELCGAHETAGGGRLTAAVRGRRGLCISADDGCVVAYNDLLLSFGDPNFKYSILLPYFYLDSNDEVWPAVDEPTIAWRKRGCKDPCQTRQEVQRILRALDKFDSTLYICNLSL